MVTRQGEELGTTERQRGHSEEEPQVAEWCRQEEPQVAEW